MRTLTMSKYSTASGWLWQLWSLMPRWPIAERLRRGGKHRGVPSTDHDPDSSPIIFYALSALQLHHGVISPKIRKRALTIINSGDGMERRRGAPVEIGEARKKLSRIEGAAVAMG